MSSEEGVLVWSLLCNEWQKTWNSTKTSDEVSRLKWHNQPGKKIKDFRKCTRRLTSILVEALWLCINVGEYFSPFKHSLTGLSNVITNLFNSRLGSQSSTCLHSLLSAYSSATLWFAPVGLWRISKCTPCSRARKAGGLWLALWHSHTTRAVWWAL